MSAPTENLPSLRPDIADALDALGMTFGADTLRFAEWLESGERGQASDVDELRERVAALRDALKRVDKAHADAVNKNLTLTAFRDLVGDILNEVDEL